MIEFLAGFLVGIVVITILCVRSHSHVIDKYIKAGFIRDSEYNIYKIEKDEQ